MMTTIYDYAVADLEKMDRLSSSLRTLRRGYDIFKCYFGIFIIVNFICIILHEFSYLPLYDIQTICFLLGLFWVEIWEHFGTKPLATPNFVTERILALSIFDCFEFPTQTTYIAKGPTDHLFSTLSFMKDTKIVLKGQVGIQNLFLTLDTGASSNIVNYNTYLSWKKAGSITSQKLQLSR